MVIRFKFPIRAKTVYIEAFAQRTATKKYLRAEVLGCPERKIHKVLSVWETKLENNKDTNVLPISWFFSIIACLTLKHREKHGCVVSTVATDALVLKHQAISIHNAD